MTADQKNAARLAVDLHLNSWDGTIFRMNSYSSANHAVKKYGLGSYFKKAIIELIDKHDGACQQQH